MSKKNTDNKIPIYKLTSKKRLIEYYDKWVIKNQYNKDLKVYCLMDDVEYVRQKKKGIFVFDNVTYLRY